MRFSKRNRVPLASLVERRPNSREPRFPMPEHMPTPAPHEREPDGSIPLTMLKGAVAGAVATWVMDRADWFLYEHESAVSRRQTWAVRPEHKDPAHVIASKTSQALGGGPIPQDHLGGLAVHYSIGVAPAAVYGAL